MLPLHRECTLQSSYLKHMKEQHPNDPLKCEKCSAMFNSPNGLMKHIRSHSYMKYKCDVCYKWFQFPYQINDHLKTHTGAGLYGCEHCDKKFASRNLAKAHEKSHAVFPQVSSLPWWYNKEVLKQGEFEYSRKGNAWSGMVCPLWQEL